MADIQHRFHYDEQQKIWSGAQEALPDNPNKSVGQLIFEQLQRQPQNICQICDSDKTVLTKEQMLMAAVRVATFLQKAGLRADDVVASAARNSTYMAAVVFGCFFIGTPIHTLSPNYEEQTLRQLFHITKPKIIFCDAQDYAKVCRAAGQLAATTIYAMNQPDNSEVPTISQILKTAYDNKFRPTQLTGGLEQTLAILCTSGSTGTPKAVPISNSHRIFTDLRNLRDDDVYYLPSTLEWLSALGTLIAASVYGRVRVISENLYDPAEFLRMVAQHKITWVLLSPPQICSLLSCEDLHSAALAGIRYFVYGGSGCPAQTQRRLSLYLPNARCIFAYGCTELGSLTSLHGTGSVAEWKAGSVGRPKPGVRIKIIDEDGACQGVNCVGEICCDNGQQWAGYYGNAEATRAVMDEAGWFHTGDMGYVDEQGNLCVVDRKKDMLKYMGVMYYPTELEEVIARMPDVLEVCVFGVFDECVGDAAAAAVVPRMGSALSPQDVVEFVRRNVSAKYKELHGGAFILPGLPKLTNGKIIRRIVLLIPRSEEMSYECSDEQAQQTTTWQQKGSTRKTTITK